MATDGESAARMQVDEEAFKAVRDALVSKVLDLGFLSHLNKVGLVMYGAVRLSVTPVATVQHQEKRTSREGPELWLCAHGPRQKCSGIFQT